MTGVGSREASGGPSLVARPLVSGAAHAAVGPGHVRRGTRSRPWLGRLPPDGRRGRTRHLVEGVRAAAQRGSQLPGRPEAHGRLQQCRGGHQRRGAEPLTQGQAGDVVRAVERHGEDGVEVDEGAHAEDQQRDGPAARGDRQQRQERHGREDVALVDTGGQDEEGDGQEGGRHEQRPAVIADGATHGAPEEAADEEHGADGHPGIGPSSGTVSSDQDSDSASDGAPPDPTSAQALKALTLR